MISAPGGGGGGARRTAGPSAPRGRPPPRVESAAETRADRSRRPGRRGRRHGRRRRISGTRTVGWKLFIRQFTSHDEDSRSRRRYWAPPTRRAPRSPPCDGDVRVAPDIEEVTEHASQRVHEILLQGAPAPPSNLSAFSRRLRWSISRDDRLLVREVAIRGRHPDARALRDMVRRERLEAARLEQLRRGCDDGLHDLLQSCRPGSSA